MTRRWTAAAAAVLLWAVTSCGEPDVEESKVDVEQMREQVVADVREVEKALRGAGLATTQPTGSYATCGTPPAASYEYRASMKAQGAGDTAAVVAQIAAALKEAGWETESEGSAPRPYANVTRGDVRVNVVESRQEPEVVTVGVVHDCVEGSTEIAGDLLGETEEL